MVNTSAIETVAITPDNSLILANSEDNIKVWDAANGEEVATLSGHTAEVDYITVTYDRRRIVSGSCNEVKIWEVGSWQEISTVWEKKGQIAAVALSPNDGHIVCGETDGIIRVWDIYENKETEVLSSHTTRIPVFAFTPDGQFLLSASDDRTICIWDIRTGQLVTTLSGHVGPVNALSVTPDGQHAISGSEDGTVRIWNIGSGQEVALLGVPVQEKDPVPNGDENSDAILSISVDPTGHYIVSGTTHQRAVGWDIAKPEHPEQLFDLEAEINPRLDIGIFFTPDGRRFTIRGIASSPRGIEVHKCPSGELLTTLNHGTESIWGLRMSSDGRYLVSGTWERKLRLWEVPSEALYTKQAVGGGRLTNSFHMALTPDAKYGVWAYFSTVSFIDRSTDEPEGSVIVEDSPVNGVAITPDGRYVAASREDTVVVGDSQTKETWELSGHPGSGPIAITPDARLIISDGLGGKVVRIWDRGTGKGITTLHGHKEQITAVAITPDGRYAVAGSSDGSIRVWSVRRRKPVALLTGHNEAVLTVAITPDGQYVVSGGWSQTTKVWRVAGATEVSKLESIYDSTVYDWDTKGIGTVAISEDGQYVVAGGEDERLHVWDVTTGRHLARFTTLGVPLACNITADGLIACGSSPGSIYLLQLEQRQRSKASA